MIYSFLILPAILPVPPQFPSSSQPLLFMLLLLLIRLYVEGWLLGIELTHISGRQLILPFLAANFCLEFFI